jgi:hypothetical protein
MDDADRRQTKTVEFSRNSAAITFSDFNKAVYYALL